MAWGSCCLLETLPKQAFLSVSTFTLKSAPKESSQLPRQDLYKESPCEWPYCHLPSITQHELCEEAAGKDLASVR